jgi:hypothetical protein
MAGCATLSSWFGKKSAKPAQAAEPVAPKRVKLAVFKVESEQFPDLARALNTQLQDVHIKGVDDYFLSKVTMEVVQLSIECVEQTPACWSAVGKSLAAQKLLMAKLTAGPVPKKGRKRDRVPAVNVQITLFDTEAGAPSEEANKQFKNQLEASEGLTALVQQAIGEAPATATATAAATPAPAAASNKSAKPSAKATR